MRLHRALRWPVVAVAFLVSSLIAPAAVAAQEPEPRHAVSDGQEDRDEVIRDDPSASLQALDEARADMVISEGPFARITKNLQLRGRGERLVENATTDVWAHGNFAYTGTFNSPCGGEPDAGVWVWDVRNKTRPSFVGVIDSPTGSRSNDVKVASLNSGDILVHSNEACAEGGPGGFEIYDVDDPREPVRLASVRIDDPNPALHEHPNGVIRAFSLDVGVHNLFLFSQGERDFVTAVTEGWFGNFHLYEITNPAEPQLLSVWGAEELCDLAFCEGVDFLTEDDPDLLFDIIVDWLLDGFGDSRNRFLHDITVNADGTRAYLSNWDAGLVLLDVSDPANPLFISTALDPENGSLDGEVNSHAAWPSEDGSIVVETEEDFDVFASIEPFRGTFGEVETNTIPGVGVSTRAGDDFEDNQTGNNVTVSLISGIVAEVVVNSGPLAGNEYEALEFAGNQPLLADTGPVTGNAVWIGLACDDATTLNADQFEVDDVAIARRGDCLFATKLANAAALGASAIVIANNVGDSVWGGVRIWDYSDEENPALASTFNTVCSADPNDESCDPLGTYSVHNVIVETTDDGQVKAYISWYWDGMLVLDVTDPSNPAEIARFFDGSPEFIEGNGGNPHDFWGVYKVPDQPWIYGSDRNGGLYTFIEQGSGSGKK